MSNALSARLFFACTVDSDTDVLYVIARGARLKNWTYRKHTNTQQINLLIPTVDQDIFSSYTKRIKNKREVIKML